MAEKPQEQRGPGKWARQMAQVCRYCPLCILRRRFPNSGFGRFAAVVEKPCPFCRAYNAVYGPGAAGNAT